MHSDIFWFIVATELIQVSLLGQLLAAMTWSSSNEALQKKSLIDNETGVCQLFLLHY